MIFICLYMSSILKERTERRQHIEEQFQGRVEFALHWIEAIEHSIGAVGLWQSMLKGCTNSYRQKGMISLSFAKTTIYLPPHITKIICLPI